MGESSFWYRPTRVVPDQRPLNGRREPYYASKKIVNQSSDFLVHCTGSYRHKKSTVNYNSYFRLTPFSDIHISQGSVATCLRCGQIFKHVCCKFTTKSISENWLTFGEVMGKSLVFCFFDSQCIQANMMPESVKWHFQTKSRSQNIN